MHREVQVTLRCIDWQAVSGSRSVGNPDVIIVNPFGNSHTVVLFSVLLR